MSHHLLLVRVHTVVQLSLTLVSCFLFCMYVMYASFFQFCRCSATRTNHNAIVSITQRYISYPFLSKIQRSHPRWSLLSFSSSLEILHHYQMNREFILLNQDGYATTSDLDFWGHPFGCHTLNSWLSLPQRVLSNEEPGTNVLPIDHP